MAHLPDSLAQSQAEVSARLTAHLDEHAQTLATVDQQASILSLEIEQLLSGGKRHRPALCYWAWRGFASAEESRDEHVHGRALDLAVALETFQAAALFHDDLIDSSDLRRGLPTAHRSFEAQHRSAGWSGDAAAFGNSVAVLLGDLTLVLANSLAARAVSGLAPEIEVRTRKLFDDMQTTVTVGQYLDVQAQVSPWGIDPNADEERARAIIRAKTATYSFLHPLLLGASLAGANEQSLAALQKIGVPIGEAYQLRDDLLGVFGDPEVTGKPAGDDLREGKRTVLIARTFAAASAAEQDFIRQHLGSAELSRADVDEFRSIMTSTGAVAALERLIADLSEPALASLARLEMEPQARAILLELSEQLLHRNS